MKALVGIPVVNMAAGGGGGTCTRVLILEGGREGPCTVAGPINFSFFCTAKYIQGLD